MRDREGALCPAYRSGVLAWLHLILVLAFGAGILAPVEAQRHPPEIRGVFPLGGRRGGKSVVTVSGASLREATGVLFAGGRGDVSAHILPLPANLPMPTPDSDGDPNIQMEVNVGSQAAPGLYYFRIVTPRGVSSVGKWLVSRDAPDLLEQEPNNTLAQAQSVTLPVSVNGHISDAGDADNFAFSLEAGKTFVAEVSAQPLDSPLDSLLTLHGPDGQEVASNDDANGPDSRLVYEVKTAGRYVLTVSSSVQVGGPNYAYRLSFGILPLLQAVYPAVNSSPLSPIGINLPREANFASFSEYARLNGRTWLETTLGCSNPMPFDGLFVQYTMEREPNDTPQSAVALRLPCGANGRFWREGRAGADEDYYRFHVEAGQRWIFEARCAAIGTQGDPVLTLFDSENTRLDGNNDPSRNARLDRTFAKAGDYYLRIQNLVGRSAPDLVYSLTISAPPPPGFALATETRARVVERGNSVPFEVTIVRDRWEGQVTLSAANLPPGVTASSCVVPAGASRGLLVLTAEANAPLAPFPLVIVGKANVNGKETTTTLQSANDWVWRGGGRTLAPIPNGLLQLAVGEPAEIQVQTDAQTLELRRGASVKVKVRAVRRNGYSKPIVLRAVGLPDGVEAADVALPGDKTEAELELKAKPDARIGAFSIALDGLVSHNPAVQLDRAAPALLLTVTEVPKVAPEPAKPKTTP